MKNSYRILKLRSGEELIAELRGESNNKLILQRPMIFKSIVIPDPFGKQKEITILKNWLSHTNEIQTKIPKDFIATYLKPDNDVVELYDLEKEKQDKDLNPKRKIIDTKKDNPFSSEEPKKLDDMTPEDLNDFLNMVKREMDENPDAFEDEQSLMPPNMKNFINMSIFLPPEALLSLVDAGLLDIEDVNALIDSMRNDNYKGNDKKRQTEEDFGTDWKDWSPDPEDYLK
tara:strand:- start:427 stop:1113 length:687 start_codon:yes stop_codon:yes gene_type:complete